MRYLKFLLVLFLLYSCGSRKVEKHNKSSSESITATELSNTDVTVLQLTKEQFSSLIFELEIKGDSLTTKSNGYSNLYRPKINVKGIQQSGVKTDSIETDIKVNTDFKFQADSNDDESGKITEKKQFNWWFVILPVLIIIFIIRLLYKYLK